MAVTIGEMQVDVTDAPSQQSGPAPAAPDQQGVDLSAALDVLRERECRLRAD